MHFIKLRMDHQEARLLAISLLRTLERGQSIGGVESNLLDRLMLAGVITEKERWSWKDPSAQQVAEGS